MSGAQSPAKYICLGAHHMDWRARLRAHLLAGESNPASTDIRPGGVAHNVWQALRQLKLDAELASLPAPETRIYMAVEHADGTLAHGIACLDAYEQLDASFLAQHQDQINNADVLVVDGNCTQDFFAALPHHPCLALVAVSPAKVSRMKDAVARASWLFCNRAEFGELRSMGIELAGGLHIVETRGGEGLCLHSHGQVTHFPAPEIEVAKLDETGLGDAMAACILAQVHCNDPALAVSDGLRQFPELLKELESKTQ